jgi:Secretion system C-terminal sorting domain
MMKKLTLLIAAFVASFTLNAQSGTDEPCNATLLSVYSSCALVTKSQGSTNINPPAFTRSTSASAGVTLPTLTCNGFNTGTRDFWYRCVVPASGKVIITVEYGNDDVNSTDIWDMAAYSSSSSTCAGSVFTQLDKECLASTVAIARFPYLRLSGLTAGSTVYIRMWLEAAATQTTPASFAIFAVDGSAALPPTCATPVSPTSGITLKNDPLFVWNNDPMTQSYDVYFGKTSSRAAMSSVTDIAVRTPTQAREGFVLPHGDALATAPNNILVQPNALNYWFVYQKNCASDPAFVPNCTLSSYTAAAIPTNDNCAGAILLNENGVYKTYSSASSTESQLPVCSASSTASDVWFKFTTSSAASPSVTVSVTSTLMDAVVEVFSGSCGALTPVDCVDLVVENAEEVLVLTGLTPNTTYYVQVYNWDGNDYLYGEEFNIKVAGNIVIPVELTSFTGKTQGNKNVLNWQTATERNAQSFIIERSANGENGFVAIGSVKAIGTSSTPQNYAFLDENPFALTYYRLRQVEMDGKTELSKTVSVQRKDKFFALENTYPSPVTSELTVQYSAERNGVVSLKIMDILGRVLWSENVQSIEGENFSKLNVSHLSTGSYILQLSNGQKSVQTRIVKQ